jgi:hypothetical protein
VESSTPEIIITGTSLQRGVALDVLQDRDAVELMHDNVEQDDVARIVVEQLQRLGAVLRAAHPVPLALQAESGVCG